jgi:hypothetical protein
MPDDYNVNININEGAGGGTGGTTGKVQGGQQPRIKADYYEKTQKDSEEQRKSAEETKKHTKKLLPISAGVVAAGVGLGFIAKHSKIISTTVGALFQIIGAAIDIMLTPLIPLITTLLPLLVEKLFPIMFALGEKIAVWLEKFIAWIGRFFANPSEAIVELFQWMMDMTIKFLMWLKENVREWMPRILELIQKIIPFIVKAISWFIEEILIPLTKMVWDFIKQLAIELFHKLPESWQEIILAIVAVVSWVWDLVQGVWNAIKECWIQSGGDIFKFFMLLAGKFYNWAWNTASKVWNWIKDHAGDIWNMIGKVASDVWDAICSFAKEFWNFLWATVLPKAIEIFVKILKWFLTDFVPAVIKFVMIDLPRFVSDAISAFVKELPGIVAELVKAAVGMLNPFNWFQGGTPYVQENQLAVVHKGERIIPAHLNRPANTVAGGMNTMNAQYTFVINTAGTSFDAANIASEIKRTVRDDDRNQLFKTFTGR